MHKLTYVALALLFFSSGTSFARKGQRSGFNFGASLRLLSGADQTTGQSGQPNGNNNTSVSTSSQAVSPFVGYAFQEFLNVGAMVYLEKIKNDSTDRSKDGTSEVIRHQVTSVSGAGLFMRFLFARVMFFEGGFGLYEQRISSDTESRELSGPNVAATRTSNETHGIGPGYHGGGGLEIPIASNFYFTSSYLVRVYQQRDYDAHREEIGPKRAREQRQELTFGLIHYYQ